MVPGAVEETGVKDSPSRGLADFIGAAKDGVTDLKIKTIPMAAGSDRAMVAAKNYANQERLAQMQWARFDETLKKRFTEPQLVKMWNAADEENDLRRDGITSSTKGLNSLDPEERKTVELLHRYGEQLLNRARDNGMFSGEGVPYWAPRMAVNDILAHYGSRYAQLAQQLRQDPVRVLSHPFNSLDSLGCLGQYDRVLLRKQRRQRPENRAARTGASRRHS